MPTTHKERGVGSTSKRVVRYKGKSYDSIRDLLRHLNLEGMERAVRQRLSNGWDIVEAVETPIRKRRTKAELEQAELDSEMEKLVVKLEQKISGIACKKGWTYNMMLDFLKARKAKVITQSDIEAKKEEFEPTHVVYMPGMTGTNVFLVRVEGDFAYTCFEWFFAKENPSFRYSKRGDTWKTTEGKRPVNIIELGDDELEVVATVPSDDKVFLDALTEYLTIAEGDCIYLWDAITYANKLMHFSMGLFPFDHDEEFMEWQEECEALGLRGNPDYQPQLN